ncbi:MAG: hypothetical protein ACFFD1_05290 [Candidatus Thorarchaeota archaeon]
MISNYINSYQWLFLTSITSPPAITIPIGEWEKFGEKRAQFLIDFQHYRESDPTLKNYANVIEKHFGINPTNDTFNEMYIGHLFLRAAAALNARLESWLKETEGDVFEYFFRQLPNDNDKLKVLQILFGSTSYANTAENVIDLIGIDTRDIQNYNLIPIREKGWAIKFSVMPNLIARKLLLTPSRKAKDHEEDKFKPKIRKNNSILHKGFIFGFPNYFFGTIKKIYEKRLLNEIYDLKRKDSIDSEIEKELKKFITKFSEKVKFTPLRSNSLSFTNLGPETSLYDKMIYYPPCMRYLRSKLEESGHIPHLHRVQLGIFLKAMGMDVETQLRYWYNTAIDNVNISYDTFNRRAGYQIRHLYGLEGGRRDYAVPKCQTLISDYFCLFQNISIKILKENLLFQFENELKGKNDELNQVLMEAENYQPRKACSELFKLITDKNAFISHPLVWVKGILKSDNSGEEKITEEIKKSNSDEIEM